MQQYKLLALDMDGTLLNDSLDISEANQYWIRKAIDHGVIVMFSTGRGYINAINYAQQLKLEAPMITVNGGEIWLKPGELLQRTTLDVTYIEQLYKLGKQYGDVWFWAYDTKKVYNKENWHELAGNYASHSWLKFGYYDEDVELINELRDQIASWQSLEISNSSIYNIEINPLGISKASALDVLCQHLNIKMSEVIAVGDSLNDIKAIEAAGLGVAMENAQQAVKDAANVVTLSNNEDGVADVIRRYIFNE